MKITAIIAEYNPFHNGHLYQLNKAKEETKPDVTIAVMSGNFTQRGKSAVLDKYLRSIVAVKQGVDIVVELPTVFAINSAEYFSRGAINVIKNLPNVTLSFGSELGDVDKLIKLANYTTTKEYDDVVKENLSKGLGYQTASVNALNSLEAVGSNDILAIEYVKNAIKYSNISLHTVKRVNNFNENTAVNGFLSASAIRNLQNKEDAKSYMPDYSYEKFALATQNDKLNDMILGALLSKTKEELSSICGINEGLENRIISTLNLANGYEDFYSKLKTKRYSNSRLDRALLNTVLNVTKSTLEKVKDVGYLSVLAIKKDKLSVLGYLNNYTKVITKYADTKLLNNEEKLAFDVDEKANVLYGLNHSNNKRRNMLIIE